MNAEKFSTLPCPYWCSASAGLSETRTESKVTKAATRSRPEWAASERMPRLCVETPTNSFRTVMARAERKELKATRRFSARMSCNTGFISEVATPLLSQFLQIACRTMTYILQVPYHQNGKVYFKMIRTLVILALALTGATAQSQNPATAPKPRTASPGQSPATKKPPV